MDINLLFEAGEMACGRVLRELPENDIKSPKQYMAKVLRVKTMPSINRLYPVILKRVIKTSELECIGQNAGYTGWRIPEHLVSGLKIQNIKSFNIGSPATNIHSNNSSTFTGYRDGLASTWPNRFGRFSSANIYESQLVGSMIYADLRLADTRQTQTPRFEKPNILWINNTYANSGVFTIEFCLDNDVNLISLDDDVYEGVKRLFILDLKSSIYDEYVTWSTIDTSIGTIDLRIEEWSGAENERMELFDQFDSLSHLRRHSIKYG